jgi:hypothetical protein
MEKNKPGGTRLAVAFAGARRCDGMVTARCLAGPMTAGDAGIAGAATRRAAYLRPARAGAGAAAGAASFLGARPGRVLPWLPL